MSDGTKGLIKGAVAVLLVIGSFFGGSTYTKVVEGVKAGCEAVEDKAPEPAFTPEVEPVE